MTVVMWSIAMHESHRSRLAYSGTLLVQMSTVLVVMYSLEMCCSSPFSTTKRKREIMCKLWKKKENFFHMPCGNKNSFASLYSVTKKKEKKKQTKSC